MSVSHGGAYVREHFFGPDPRLRKMVEHLSDDQLLKLRRGGHDYRKVYAAYLAATEFTGAPTVILAKTVKGWTLGRGVEARNITHQAKKLDRGRAAGLPRPPRAADPRRQAQGRAVLPPGPGLGRGRSTCSSAARRSAARCRGGSSASQPLPAPARGVDKEFDAGSTDRRLDDDGVHAAAAQPDPRPAARQADRADHPRRGAHLRHGPAVQGGRHLRRRAASATSRSTPSSCSPTARRRTARCSRRASTRRARWPRFRPPARRYATHGEPMIPFYIFYSMFGFQRTGDQAWAFGDQRGRGFLIGATAGPHDAHRRGPPARRRPQPGPRLDRARDPRLRPGVRLRAGDDRPRRHRRACTHDGEDVFYYVTRLQRELPAAGRSPTASTRASSRASTGSRAAQDLPDAKGRVRLVGSGSILQQVLAARDLLAEKFGDRRRGLLARPRSSSSATRRSRSERWNRLHPDKKPRVPYVTQVLGHDDAPVDRRDRLAQDPARHRRAAGRRSRYIVLGTDGFGRSDTARRAAGALRDRPAEHRRGRPRGPRPVRRLRAQGGRGRDPRARARPGRAGPPDRLTGRGPGRPTMRRRPAWLEVFAVSLRLGLTSFGGPVGAPRLPAHGVRRRARLAGRAGLRRARGAVPGAARARQQPALRGDRAAARGLAGGDRRLGRLHAPERGADGAPRASWSRGPRSRRPGRSPAPWRASRRRRSRSSPRRCSRWPGG